MSRLAPSIRRLLFVLPVAALTVSCASGGPSGERGTKSRPASVADRLVPDSEERALLLLMTDRKIFEPLAVAGAMDGDAALRRDTALALGRIGDLRGLPPLERLAGAPEAEVRRAAVFALGELAEVGHVQAVPSLLGALKDRDRQVGALAVEALWKSGVDLETVVAKLIDTEPDELLPRLLPALFRFDSPGVVRWAEQALEKTAEKETPGAETGRAYHQSLRRQAAYALGREPRPEGAPHLRRLLADDDPWIRGWAARALGTVGDRGDLERLLPLLRPLLGDPGRDSTAEGPAIQALRAAEKLIEAGDASPPGDWRPVLLELLRDPRPGERLTAIEASSAWLLDEEIAARLLALARDGLGRERELALLALAEGEDPRLALVLPTAATSPDASVRAAAVRAAGFAGDLELLAVLVLDDDPLVRRTAYDTLFLAAPDRPAEPPEILARALDDPDAGVRALALGWGGERLLLDVPTLDASWELARRDRIPDARLAVVAALTRLAGWHLSADAVDGAAPEGLPPRRAEVGRAALDALQRHARDPEWLVRRAAVGSLRALEEVAGELRIPALGAVDTGREIATYRDMVRRTREDRVFDLVTERGTVTLEIACPRAPITCLGFAQLASQGFYDGLEFHRIVPDFVVQGGDPRGDGLGGPGYHLRDEVNLLRFERHVVGMAHAGPDTAGSQFFVTLSPQPHLDGAYTAFGRVIGGGEVLHDLLQGDLIVRMEERLGPAR